MKIFTTGYELCTAITNLVIFIITVILLSKINNKKWKIFYYFILIDSFLGIIIHGIKMSQTVNDILWIILLILFSITFNLLLHIFCNTKIKNVIIISIVLFILLLFELLFKLDYIITLLTYALIVVLICLYKQIKNNNKNKYYFIIGIIIQLLGVIPIYLKLSISIYNYNCICHTFTLITIILFYLGLKKE